MKKYPSLTDVRTKKTQSDVLFVYLGLHCKVVCLQLLKFSEYSSRSIRLHYPLFFVLCNDLLQVMAFFPRCNLQWYGLLVC